jgi:hypothetical protein
MKTCAHRLKMIPARQPVVSFFQRRPHSTRITAVRAAHTALGNPGRSRLQPVAERRFIEPVTAIEIRDDPIPRLHHLARGFGETWLIAVDKRQRAIARAVQQTHGHGKQHETQLERAGHRS